jgi:hypothetical protein
MEEKEDAFSASSDLCTASLACRWGWLSLVTSPMSRRSDTDQDSGGSFDSRTTTVEFRTRTALSPRLTFASSAAKCVDSIPTNAL